MFAYGLIGQSYPTHKKYSSALIFAIFASWVGQFHSIFIYMYMYDIMEKKNKQASVKLANLPDKLRS